MHALFAATWNRLTRVVTIIAVTSVLASCARNPVSPAQWTIDRGGTLGSLFEDGVAGVVLVIDPAQCFTCTNLLAQWLDWGADNPNRFALVLSRETREWERRRLVFLPLSGTLEHAMEASRLPVELVIEDGRTLYQADRLAGVSASDLLVALRSQELSEAVFTLAPD